MYYKAIFLCSQVAFVAILFACILRVPDYEDNDEEDVSIKTLFNSNIDATSKGECHTDFSSYHKAIGQPHPHIADIV